VRAHNIVILTALGLEYDAVRAQLTGFRPHTDAGGTRYEIGTPRSGSGQIVLALAGEGNLAAAAITSRAIDEFAPLAVIFVGVAGGLTDSVALGDVVVATRVHAYHGGKDGPSGFLVRRKSWPVAHALEQIAREVARGTAWSASLSGAPTVHFKPIVSGEVVIDTRESDLARLIARDYSDAVAVDMESAGVAEAAHRNGATEVITVRGISDKADGRKRGADAVGWQPIAAARAAALAVALAERILQSAPREPAEKPGNKAEDKPAQPVVTSQATVRADGPITMKRSVIAGGNVTQSRTVRIGLGGVAAAVLVATAIVIGNEVGQSAEPPPVERGKIVTRDEQVIAESDPRRYPQGPLYAPVTGFLSPFFGSTGIEHVDDDALTSGNTTVVTIDPKTQQAAYEALTTRGDAGAVVAIRPKTGEITAMVSTPSFDPNLLATHENAAAKQNYERFVDDPGAPLLNRATAKTYGPGATFMLVVAAAALADGGDENTEVTAMAELDVTTGEPCPPDGTGGVCLVNFHRGPCGDGPTVTLELALERSCNTAFAKLAQDLGESRLREQAAGFGVGDTGLSVPLPVVSSCLGPSRGACMDIEEGPLLYASGVGQGDVRLTPLQNAMIAATIANGGMRMRPQLVDARPEAVGRAMTEVNAATLRDMMVRAESVTAGSGKTSGLRIASKTGTAQSGPDPKLTPPLSWYVAFAPADDPEIAIAVLIENRDDAAGGGAAAASIGRAVINAALAGGR
jgi:peptidoglycan glycosyltransferase